MSTATQKIIPIRREYNAWVADESFEDYALRYTPRAFRKWSEWRVANTALGSVSFLALEAIGASIALNYGFTNALWAIIAVALVTFLTGLPISYYAARYGLDMDLLTRGGGFGYVGSTLTSLIYAAFTFIFFALEASIMALALQIYLNWPLVWCYILSSLVIVPLVVHGITLISRLQVWTQGVWLVLLLLPYIAVAIKDPRAFRDFTGLTGRISGSSEFDWLMFGAAASVACSLVVQIGEQVDFLRFLPAKTSANRWRWWSAVVLAGPGWILPGMLKMLGGAFLAFLVLQQQVPAEKAIEPTQMYMAGFAYVFNHPTWIAALTTLFVIVSQVKINVTNAYAGSLAWSNFFARLTHSHPGRVVWLAFNVIIAMLLMTLGVFHALEKVLGLYSCVALAWIGALVADIVVNRPLKLRPEGMEFKRAHLYDINPVGLGATLLGTLLALAAYGGTFGETAHAFAPFVALFTAFALSPLFAWLTDGRWYLARRSSTVAEPGQVVRCSICENPFESEDMAHCPAYGGPICSLCCTLDSRCHDSCKQGSRVGEQVEYWLSRLLPRPMSRHVNSRASHFLIVFLSLCTLVAIVMGLVLSQEVVNGGDPLGLERVFIKAYALLVLVVAVCSWWVVLISESRRLAQEELIAQSQLLQREVDALQRTDAALQMAKEQAEAANRAKTRYVTGMTHELRTPLNSILGYSQIMLKDDTLSAAQRETIQTVRRSGDHMAALIDDLLNLAQIESGRMRLETAPVPLPHLIDELVRMVQPQAQAKGLRFEYRLQGQLPPWVKGDAKRVKQVLINLLGNAVKFTDAGRVSLRVDARNEVLQFTIEDTGVGIAPQDQQRIFLPFERGGAARRRGEPGTGLGLTITGLLTSMMGGELSMHSEPGVGSTFCVRLYMPKVADAGPFPQTHHPVTGYRGTRRVLLVVDDQPDQRQMLAGLLAPLGFKVNEAASGSECLESIEHEMPDAVLLDIAMDEMDGWATARTIRQRGYADLPIIMVSANLFDNQQSRLMDAQCQAFVGKPVLESELTAVLGRVLRCDWLQTEEGAMLAGRLAPAAFRVPKSGDAPIPVELHSRLTQLLRIGHAQGLLNLLDEYAHKYPDRAEQIAQLRHLVNHFDFEALLAMIKESRNALQH